MMNLCFMLASFLLIGAKEANGSAFPPIPAPTNLSYSWEKKKDLHQPVNPCLNCTLKLSASSVAGATHYDWEVEATNGSTSKTTTKPLLTNVYVEPGQVTVRVRARNATQVSDYYVESWDIAIPADCCLH